MNLELMAAQVAQHVTVINVVLFAALTITTVMAENPNIKGSSLWGLGKTLVLTFIDQFKPQAAPTPAAAPATQDQQVTPKQ